jgi:hypothetical protein
MKRILVVTGEPAEDVVDALAGDGIESEEGETGAWCLVDADGMRELRAWAKEHDAALFSSIRQEARGRTL